MDKEEISSRQPNKPWVIAMPWLEQNSRSIPALVRGYLCPRCAKKLGTEKKAVSAEALISRIQDCCSQNKEFINDRLPILESVFRVFLANGNQPLYLEELGQQLSERRGGDPYRTSPEVLYRLLKNDRYYGFQEITE